MHATPIPVQPHGTDPRLCTMLLWPRPQFERPATLSAPIDFAQRLVADLLSSSSLRELLDPGTLRVTIGDGNWISYECSFWNYLKCESKDLKPSLAPAAARKILRLARAPHRRAWFRTRTRPSLHYFVFLDESCLKVRGHVDAAAPLAGPFAHFVHDYLPSQGVGTHPTPEQLWRAFEQR